MSQLFEQGITKARKLPDQEQEAIAALILAEIDDEQQWEAAFAQSADKLKALAARATQQVRAGQCREAGFNEL